MVPTMRMTFGARVSGTWICTWRSMLNVNASLALGVDRRQALVEAVGVAGGVRPVQGQDRRGHDLGLVDAGVQRVLAGAQRLGPDALVARLHDRAELELLAGGVLGGQADVGLDDRHLALADDQHLAQLDLHQERVQQVRAVEQRVVLEADAAPVGQERLVVLVVVVQVVLGAQHGLDDLDGRAASASALHGGHVAEAADAAGDVARRRALQRGDHADDVGLALRRDVHDVEGVLVDLAGRRLRVASEIILPKIRSRVTTTKPTGWIGAVVPGGRTGRCTPRWPPLAEERADVGEAAELGPVDGRLGAGGQRGADLGDDQADVVGRHLDPGVALDLEDRPELEAQARA